MLSHAAMTDNSLQLVYRVAQLETELHFTQEQLSQVQGVNHYLLQQLASRGSLSSLPEQPQNTTHHERPQTSCNAAQHALPKQHRELVQDSESSIDSDVIPTSAKPSEDAGPHIRREGQARVPKSKRINESTTMLQHAPHVINNKAIDRISQYHIRRDSAVDVRQGPSHARPVSRDKQDSRPNYLGSRAHYEYHRLLGAACFIEDMDADEKAVHWRKFARNCPHASAAQWESYYESDVRPVYLEKQRARELTVTLPSRVELDNHGHALSTDAEKLKKGEGVASTSQDPQDGGLGAVPQEMSLAAPIEKLIPNLIDFDDADDKVDAPVQPAIGIEMKSSPSPSPKQTPPPTRARRMPPLEVEQLFHQASTDDPFPHRTAIITNVSPEQGAHLALTSLERPDVVSATHIRTSRMRLKNGVMETDTLMVVLDSGQRLRELVEQCDGKWPMSSPGQSDCGAAAIGIVETATHPELLAVKHSAPSLPVRPTGYIGGGRG
jgi:hypothetical protein